MVHTLTNSLIEKKKVETLEAQNLRKVVSFRDIKLIDEKSIEYKGQNIKLTESSFKDLVSLLGMSQSFTKNFETLFTKEAKMQFMNTLKNAMSSNQSKLNEVTLVLNPISRSIVSIKKGSTSLISNQQFLGIAENILDNNSMDITNWSVDPHTGIVRINAFNPNALFNVKGLSDEVFTGGVSLINSPQKGFEVLPYINRQFCSNGMTSPFAEESYILNSLDNGSMEKFFENINGLRKNNFAPTGFADRVRIANETPASLAEMKTAHNLIKSYTGERTSNWINLDENMNAYHAAGFETLTSAQMSGAKSNTSIWDITNAVTHVATHLPNIIDTNMESYDQTRLMVDAGKIFGKKVFDHENNMPNVFKGNLQRTGSLLN